MRHSKQNEGLTLLEVVVALAILATGILAVIQLYSGSLRNTKRISDVSTAIVRARSIMDQAYMGSDAPVPDRFEFKDGAVAERQVSIAEEGDGYRVYSITVRVEMPDRKIYEISSKRTILGEKEQK